VTRVKPEAAPANNSLELAGIESGGQTGQVDSAPPVVRTDTSSQLSVGDRIVIRYLDEPRARPEFHIITERPSDPLNGLLSLHSPLAVALNDASAGDEITIRIGDRDRTLLFMTLEKEPHQEAGWRST
jgi:hypothetical protein